jgi:hypothetical protein
MQGIEGAVQGVKDAVHAGVIAADEWLHPHGRYLGPDPDGHVPGTVLNPWRQVRRRPIA